MALGQPVLEPEFGHTKNSCMFDMPPESWVERILVEALVVLEIQVVLGVMIVVGDYEVLKQFFHHSNFYGGDPALVVMVVVDPFLQKEVTDQNI